MQSTSTLPGLSLPENLRRGQAEVIQRFITENSVTAKLPTGYGKTLAACGAYAALKLRGEANRMLYIVPRRNQAKQAAASIPAELAKEFGIKTTSIIVGDSPTVALRYNRLGSTEVFITTIQGLATSTATKEAVRELTASGRWFLVIDEYHNIPEHTNNGTQGKWLEAINSVPYSSRLVMSATPRLDRNDPFPPPDVSVTYYEAYKDKCVKEMHLHEYEYKIDAVSINGEVFTFTTGDIDNGDFEKAILEGKMRWSPKYISPLITLPAERILDLRMRGINVQMLVQALSCTHAEVVCSQIKTLLPNFEVDWVGTGPKGKSQKENDTILDRFCPDKNEHGQREWTLDVLVNVGMAGEGLDTQDVAEVTFLTGVNITVSNLQTKGRGSRVMYDVNGEIIEVICNINVDTESTIAKEDKYLGKKVMAVFDNDENMEAIKEDEEGDHIPGESEYREMPEQPLVVIADVNLIDVKKEPGFEKMFELVKGVEGRGRSDVEIIELVRMGMEQERAKRNAQFNISSELAQLKQSIEAAVSKIVSLVIRRINESGFFRIEKSLAGDLKKRINTKKKYEFGGVNDLTCDQLRQQYQWLRSVEQEILVAPGLTGVPSWLQ